MRDTGVGKEKLAVTGAGLGGLSCAVSLARAGFDVHLFERSANPGGKAGVLQMGGYQFDTGPSLMTMPSVIDDLFGDTDEHPGVLPLDVLCRYFYPDGAELDSVSDPSEVARRLADLGWAEHDQVVEYFEYCRRIWDASAEFFLLRPMRGVVATVREIGVKRAFAALARLGDLDGRRTMHEANAGFFTDPRVQQLFDRRATYAGSSPYLAPATLNVIQHVDYAMGGFAVDGGVRSLVRALVRLAESRGVKLHLSTPVERILTDDGRVTGVMVEGERLAFDAVVSNADVNVTYRDLLGDTRSRAARRYAALEPSSSAVVFYWGVRGSHPELDVHNIVFSGDYRTEFEDLFVNHTCPRDPTIYIYLSCRYAPDDAPDGCENWFTMINAPHDGGQDWEAEVARARETIVHKLRERLGVDIEPRIEQEAVLDPPELQRRTASRHGSIYGISSNSKWAAFQRQHNRCKHHRGLYFCGGSAHPGGGMPLVLLSGKMAAEHVREDLRGR